MKQSKFQHCMIVSLAKLKAYIQKAICTLNNSNRTQTKYGSKVAAIRAFTPSLFAFFLPIFKYFIIHEDITCPCFFNSEQHVERFLFFYVEWWSCWLLCQLEVILQIMPMLKKIEKCNVEDQSIYPCLPKPWNHIQSCISELAVKKIKDFFRQFNNLSFYS